MGFVFDGCSGIGDFDCDEVVIVYYGDGVLS